MSNYRSEIRELKQQSYTTKEVAEILDLDPTTIRSLIVRENLSFKIGGKHYVKKDRLHSYIAKIVSKADSTVID